MPEGPECTRTAKQVNRYVKGLTLVNVNVISGRYTKKLPDGFDELMSFLPLKVLPNNNPPISDNIETNTEYNKYSFKLG